MDTGLLSGFFAKTDKNNHSPWDSIGKSGLMEGQALGKKLFKNGWGKKGLTELFNKPENDVSNLSPEAKIAILEGQKKKLEKEKKNLGTTYRLSTITAGPYLQKEITNVSVQLEAIKNHTRKRFNCRCSSPTRIYY